MCKFISSQLRFWCDCFRKSFLNFLKWKLMWLLSEKVISSDSERDWRIHSATSTVTEIRAALEVEEFVVEHALASVEVKLVALFLVSLERILPLASRNFLDQFDPYLKDWHCCCYMPQRLRDLLLTQHLKQNFIQWNYYSRTSITRTSVIRTSIIRTLCYPNWKSF